MKITKRKIYANKQQIKCGASPYAIDESVEILQQKYPDFFIEHFMPDPYEDIESEGVEFYNNDNNKDLIVWVDELNGDNILAELEEQLKTLL